MSRWQEPTGGQPGDGRLMGGRYQLIAKLGSGGFGHVWHARDTVLDVDVAAKQLILPPGLPEHDRIERLTRARREATNAARLRGNRNIVTVHDLVDDAGEPWLIMELIHGQSLAQYMEARGPLPAQEAGAIARAVLSALASSHAAGIVHRDVKPANVMLSADGRVVLTDFGISMLTSDDSLTGTGQFIGSVDYIAPERISGDKARAASDMFSLGALLYHMVEGAPPFRRDAAAATIGAVLLAEPAPPARAGNLTPLIAALLNKDPDARLAAQDALRMLDERAVHTATSVVPVGHSADTTASVRAVAARGRGRGRGIALSCGGLLLVGVAITAFMLHRGTGVPSLHSTTTPSTATTHSSTPPSVTLPAPLVNWQQTASFNGTSTAKSLPGVALSTGPGASFTVSAWVYLTSTSGFATAVSQDASVDSTFYLQYSSQDGAWAFSRVASDSPNPAGSRALSNGPPATDQWVHLVGVYDDSDNLMTLYVNGAAQGTATDSMPFAGSSGIVIGRAEYNGGPVDWFPGMIKNVEVFQQALSAAQVKAL